MGRWINRLNNTPDVDPTKLTEPSFVGFVSACSDHLTENNMLVKDNPKKTLQSFVEASCIDIKITPEKVLNSLLSIDDEQDILDGLLTVTQLRGFIELWISSGAKHISEKSAVVNNKE